MGTDVRLTIANGLTFAAPATAMITPATGEKLLNNPPANCDGRISDTTEAFIRPAIMVLDKITHATLNPRYASLILIK